MSTKWPPHVATVGANSNFPHFHWNWPSEFVEIGSVDERAQLESGEKLSMSMNEWNQKKKTKEERKLVCPGMGSLSVASVAPEWIIIKKRRSAEVAHELQSRYPRCHGHRSTAHSSAMFTPMIKWPVISIFDDNSLSLIFQNFVVLIEFSTKLNSWIASFIVTWQLNGQSPEWELEGSRGAPTQVKICDCVPQGMHQ